MNTKNTPETTGKKQTAKRRIKQRWPFIRERLYPSGKTAWVVDGRTKTNQEGKKAFDTLEKAETYAAICRTQRENEGRAGMENAELAKYGWTVAKAIDFALDHLRRLERSVTVTIAAAELIESRRKGGKSEEYCYGLGLRLGRFGQTFGERPAASITAKEIDGWLVGLPGAPATRNTFRRDVSTLFSFCVRRGYATTNPVEGTEMAQDDGGPVEILTAAEVAHILETCPEDLLPYTAIGVFAGLRPKCELRKLDWSEVNLEAGFIEVKAHKSKTKRRRLVKIEPALAAWLQPYAKKSGPVVSPVNLRKRLEAHHRAAGFGTPAEASKNAKLTPWKKNCLRHSFGSFWLAANQNVDACALQMGNSPEMIFEHYRELVRPREAEAFWALRPSAVSNVVQMTQAAAA